MTNRLLSMIGGGCLFIGAAAISHWAEAADASKSSSTSSKAVVASTPTNRKSVLPPNAPEEFVCWDKKGECDPIKVQETFPRDDLSVRHLIKYAMFRIKYDGEQYWASLESPEWLSAFQGAGPLDWLPGGELMPDAVCVPKFKPTLTRVPFLDKKTNKERTRLTDTRYSHFESRPMAIHLNQYANGHVDHTWFIYPLSKDNEEGKHSYCLTFVAMDESEGGSHDGAVHGEAN